MALYARLDAEGRLHLVNQLGIELVGSPVEILQAVEDGRFSDADIRWTGAGSDLDYHGHVREIDAPTPARFNADPRRLHGASGSAGKIAVFALRLDTFVAEKDAKVIYVGTNSASHLTTIRRRMLAEVAELPIVAEYIHRDAFDLAARYGKDTYQIIRLLGTRRLPSLFALKARLDALPERLPVLPGKLIDRLLQAYSTITPSHLPARIRRWREHYEYHLLLKVSAWSAAYAEALQRRCARRMTRSDNQRQEGDSVALTVNPPPAPPIQASRSTART